jgi:hypothetical protein
MLLFMTVGVKKYDIGVSSNSTTFIPSLAKIGKLIYKLERGPQIDRMTIS